MSERERFARLCYETDQRTNGKWETVTTMRTGGARSAVAGAYAQADALIAAGFGDVSAARAAAEIEAEPVIASEVAHRYISESLSLPRGERPEFQLDDLAPVLNFVNSKFEGHGAILNVYSDIMEEFRTGHRCSVCGRTVKQNKAIGYDCAREC